MDACPECGTPAKPDQRFCTNCGATIVRPAPPEEPPRSHGPAHRSPGTRVWTIAAAAVAVLVGVVVFLLTQGGGGTGKKAASVTTPTAPASVVVPTTDTPTLDTTSPSPSETTPTPTPTLTATAAADDPAGVVQAYFDAINQHDYQTAWNLGGKNLDSSLSHFTQGFAGTSQDVVTITGTVGDLVQVQLVAQQNDGTTISFAGSYTVVNGVITQANLSQTG